MKRYPVSETLNGMRVFLFLMFLTGFGGAAMAETVVLAPIRDNTLYEDGAGTLSNGAGIYFFAGKTAAPSLRRGLIRFDFSSIPANATVTGATLSMFLSKTHGGSATVSLSKALQNWGEGASDAGEPGGAGVQAETGDATWFHTFYDTGFWAALGGDFSTTTSASTTVNAVNVTYTWSSSALLADVQSWVSAPASNFGWVIRGNESTSGKAQRFNTRENSINPPRLTVTYDATSPTPTATPTAIIISGTILYCSNPVPDPVPSVTLNLTGDAATSTTSSGSGDYQFSAVAAGGNYVVTPSKNALTPGSQGINTVDMVATQRHFLVIVLLPPGCRLIAADVNNDTLVNTVDIVAIQRFFLSSTFGFANVGKYQFAPANRSYSGVGADQTGQNYNALIFGDVVSPFAEP